MRVRRLFSVYYVLGAIILAFSVSMVISAKNLRKYEQLAQLDITDLTRIVYRTEVELSRYLHTLDLYMYGPEELASKDDVIERMEIFWSRLPLFLQGRDGSRFAKVAGTQKAARDAIAVLENLEPSIVALRRSDRQVYEWIRPELHGLLAPLKRVLTDSSRWQDAALAIRNERLDRVYAELIVASLGIMLSGGCLALLLLHEIRISRRAQLAESDASTRLSEAIESFSDGFSLFDKDGKLVLCNQRLRDMHPPIADILVPGTSIETLIRTNMENGYIPEAVGCEEEWIERRLRLHFNPAADFEVEYADGLWYRVSERKTNDGGFVSIRTDITEFKQRQSDMANRRDKSDSANRAKTDFLLNMSHELRTPLNAIMGFSEIMKQEMRGPLGSEHYVDYAGDIFDSATHLLAVINSILDISRIEAGQLELDEQAVVLQDEVERALRQLEDEARLADTSLVHDVEQGLPLLLGDAHKIQQIVINLAGNSVRYTRPGGTVTVRACREDDGGLKLSVEDDGVGMAPEDIERVISPFVRLSNPMVRQHDGTGLGLPLVKALVELHGGVFHIESTLGEGTTVTAKFPKSRVILPEPALVQRGP